VTSKDIFSYSVVRKPDKNVLIILYFGGANDDNEFLIIKDCVCATRPAWRRGPARVWSGWLPSRSELRLNNNNFSIIIFSKEEMKN
jgi:hypothetical protein